jgi:hypothetical protein
MTEDRELTPHLQGQPPSCGTLWCAHIRLLRTYRAGGVLE